MYQVPQKEDKLDRGDGSGGGWRKVLYEKQPQFPDHYVPDSFLKDLRKNVNVRYYSLSEVILSSGKLSLQMSRIVLLIVVFNLLQMNQFATWIIISLITIALYLSLLFNLKNESISRQLKSMIIYFVTGFTMSPLLKTLTETISTDTINLMVTLMMMVHLIFFNYGTSCAIINQPISLNAAIFGAVCLASRLNSNYSALSLLIFATDVFVLPTVLPNTKSYASSKWFHLALTLGQVSLSVIGLYLTVSTVYTFLFLIVIICVNVIFPVAFYELQSMKENIYGPWDEAVINQSSSTIKT